MKRFNKAFTLTELLIALGVIGILCAILLPVIFNLLPNQNTLMAKRAYYLVQSVVADLINDEACYPDKTSANDADKRVGFDDGFGYVNCRIWGGVNNTDTITTEGNANTKFLTLFTDKLGLDAPAGGSGTVIFATGDGIDWAMTSGGFSTKNDADASATIVLDVNGKGEPDCGQSEVTAVGPIGDKCDGRTSGWDRFSMKVYADGKVEILDPWAREAVKVDKSVTDE